MSVLVSGLNKKSEDFRENENRMQEFVADLRSHVDRVAEGGGEAAQKRHLGRGKLCQGSVSITLWMRDPRF